MKSFPLLALFCLLLSGCANPLEKFVQSVDSFAQALVKHPLELAEKSVEKEEAKRAQQGEE